MVIQFRNLYTFPEHFPFSGAMYEKSYFVWGIPLKEKHNTLDGLEIPNNHQEFIIKPCK